MGTSPDYLDTEAAAVFLGISPRTLRNRRSHGRFPEPDIVLGRCPGWLPATLRDHRAGRPPRTRTGPVYLDLATIGRLIGRSADVVRVYANRDPTFPQPALVLGRCPGYEPEAVQRWIAGRPGRGAGGGRPPGS